MKYRKATNEEILEELGNKKSISYRHFTREIFMPHAKNGVIHRQHSRSAIRNIDGIPHVKYQGELVPVTANHYTLDNGTTFVALVKIDNPHLPD